MINNLHPPLINNNYMGLDPITGFDFLLLRVNPLTDEITEIGRFQELELKFDGFNSFNWSLEKGLLDTNLFCSLFGLDKNKISSCSFPRKNPDFIIAYNKEDDTQILGVCNLDKNRLDNIQLVVVPGRKTVAIKLEGTSLKFEYFKR